MSSGRVGPSELPIEMGSGQSVIVVACWLDLRPKSKRGGGRTFNGADSVT
ncbi:hypothetical protein RchiOBHm_Chr7g0216941 [Rosa chinensis]|uniref:Uncharacterized protein n=1 Tax=Rosa chinensis TaxID=74649 RepID=A0A2P6PBV4_ROSCH|nr:hypothetical protein RchiOBHm_Chr7g0216941 [Rosa chinensis]